MYRKVWKVLLGRLVHVPPSNFFRRILRSEALVYKSYFFQNSRSTEIIRRQILIQSLPTRQDGVENCHKVYRPFLAWISSDCFQSFSPLSNWDETQARPLAACHSRCTKPPYWDANVALGQDKQGNYHLKLCMPYVGLAPVRLLQLVLRSYTEVFPNCNTLVDVRLY